MPSGAKKRKAAKKKQEKESNTTNSSTHSHGADDLKVHDEKYSDGGERSSPTSQDHQNHQHPFTEGVEGMQKVEDISSVQSITTETEPMVGFNSDGESMQKVAVEENSGIQIDWELNPEDDFDSKNVSIGYVESVKERDGREISQDGGSSSSSSSSDDESHDFEKNIVVIESGESKEDAPNSAAESAAFADSEKVADSPEFTQVTNGVPVMDAYKLSGGEPKEEAYDPVAGHAPSVNLIKPADLPDVTQVSDGFPVIEASSLVVGKSTEEACNSIVETIALVNSENACKEVVHVNDSVPVENAVCANAFELGLKENGKNENSGVSPGVMDLGSQPKEAKASTTSVEDSAVSLVAARFAAKEDENKLLPTSSVPAVDTSIVAAHMKDPVITECSDSQPVVASAPRPVQTTFWTSCCGLFEVFTGSNR